MQRYWIANLELPPSHIWAEDGALLHHHEEWVQSNELWSLVLYDHNGVVHINARTILYEAGDLLVYPPGCKIAHPKIGEHLRINRVSFPLEGTGGRMAVPVKSSLPKPLQEMFISAELSSGHKVGYIKSVVWALLWHIAEPESVYRMRSDLYECEEFIRKNLALPLSVNDISNHINVPERTIQRLFKHEHGVGVASFVRECRIREAVRRLVDTDDSIKSIALAVGMSTSQRFYQFIKEFVGASPSEIRAHQGPLATATFQRKKP